MFLKNSTSNYKQNWVSKPFETSDAMTTVVGYFHSHLGTNSKKCPQPSIPFFGRIRRKDTT